MCAAAAKALHELGIDDIACVAKRLEEVWLPDVEEPVILPRTSEGLYLLQRLRDEAHRFDPITGPGAASRWSNRSWIRCRVSATSGVRPDQLLRLIKKLRAATVEEIAAVPGFRPKTALAIKEALQQAPQPEAIDMATGEVLDSLGPRGARSEYTGIPRLCGPAPNPEGQLDTESPTKPLRLVVVSGMACAGRSTAAHSLEDLGWYVVDNLPPSVPLPDVWRQAQEIDLTRLAVVLDAHPGLLRAAPIDVHRTAIGTMPEILFLEAADDVIVRRQSPYAGRIRCRATVGCWMVSEGSGRVADAACGRRSGDRSSLNIHQLSRVAHAPTAATMISCVMLLSFGFKYGIPVDADMIFDVRFLPNPHWIPELRPQTGLASR